MKTRSYRIQERLASGFVVALLLAGAWFVADSLHVAGHAPAPLGLVFEDMGAVPEEAQTVAAAPANTTLERQEMNGPLLSADPAPEIRAAPRRSAPVHRIRRAPSAAPAARTAAQRFVVESAAARTRKDAAPSIGLSKEERQDSRRDIRRLTVESPTLQREAPKPSVDREAGSDSTALQVDTIIEWMRLHASELPPGIRRHTGLRSGNLSATAALMDGGDAYEVYLLARVPVREIHIVLVRGEETYYLIDRSFQREGRSFRVGYARREGSVITGVVSEERAASSPEASRFYRVFLSWWDKERLRL